MIFKGEEISLNALATKTGISNQTLIYRYKVQGLRDDELITGKKRATQLVYNGETIEVTKDIKQKFVNKGLSVKGVQKRLDDGWDFDLAVNLSKSYVTIDDTICLQFKRGKHFYHIPYDEMDVLAEENISTAMIRNGLTKGNDIYNIVPVGTIVYINGVKHTGDDEWDKEMEQKIENSVKAYKEERLREKKAHLYKVPQQHSESRYAKYLWESYTFKCKEVAK